MHALSLANAQVHAYYVSSHLVIKTCLIHASDRHAWFGTHVLRSGRWNEDEEKLLKKLVEEYLDTKRNLEQAAEAKEVCREVEQSFYLAATARSYGVSSLWAALLSMFERVRDWSIPFVLDCMLLRHVSRGSVGIAYLCLSKLRYLSVLP